MSDCRFGVSPVNYPDPDPDPEDRTRHRPHARRTCIISGQKSPKTHFRVTWLILFRKDNKVQSTDFRVEELS